jgi:small subunit ribosomal protein S18
MAENTEAPAVDREREVVTGDEGFDKMPRRTYQRRRPRQVVPDYVDWKDVDYLRQFIPERGKIMPRRISGITAKDQRRIATAIKRARSMALLPFVWE